MLTTVNSSALVGTATSPMTATRHIRVDRPFRLDGVVRPVGDVVEVPTVFAAEMVAAHKATVVDKPLPPPAPPVVEAVEDEKPAPKKVFRNAR